MNYSKTLSIITIAYNARSQGLEKTLHSVTGNIGKFPDVEYVVIDGCSNDGSHELYGKYSGSFSQFISEPDKGISDAFNKGVRLSSGKFLWFINAGDYLSEDNFEKVLCFLRDTKIDIVYGDMIWVDVNGKESLKIASSNYEPKIRYVMPFMHPSTIVSSSVFRNVGFFDCRLKRAMDYDLILRAYLYGFRADKINLPLSFMVAGGTHDQHYYKTVLEVMFVSIFSGGRVYKAVASMLYTWLCQRSSLFVKVKKLIKNQR